MSIDTAATHLDVKENTSKNASAELDATNIILDQVNGERSTHQVADAAKNSDLTGLLPEVEIDNGGLDDVIGDLFHGAVEQITQNPLEVLKNVAIGAAIGAGTVLLAPEIAIGAAVIGATAGVYQLATNLPGWLEDADIVANPDQHTAAEVAQSHEDLEDLGGGITNFVAGGLAGGLSAKATEILAQNMLKTSLAAEEGAFTNWFRRNDPQGAPASDLTNQYVNATFRHGGAPFKVPGIFSRNEAEMMTTNMTGKTTFTTWDAMKPNYRMWNPLAGDTLPQGIMMKNLTDPAEISAFAKAYYRQSPRDAGPTMLYFSKESGAQQAWLDAIAKLPNGGL